MNKYSYLLAILLITSIQFSANAGLIIIDSSSEDIFFAGKNESYEIIDGANIGTNDEGYSIEFGGYYHEINVTGGILQGGIIFGGYDHIFNISGGDFGGNIKVSGFNHIFNFSGIDLVYTNEHISGFLLDGTFIDLQIDGGRNLTVNISNVPVPVPEPATLSIFFLCLLMLFLSRKKFIK